MNHKLPARLVRVVSVCCAILLFIAVLPAPREYYWILRIAVFIGAILVMLQNSATPYWVVLFGVVLVLFNPIVPIHLYRKAPWIPINLATGLLFLAEIVINRPKKAKSTPVKKENKKYERDRIL